MTRGGKRIGAGRKARFSSSTKVMRIPTHLLSDVRRLLENPQGMHLPLYSSRVSAGFPSPADDHIEARLDLNEHLIDNPSATFFLRAEGESMRDAGIYDGDLLIVDRSIDVRVGHVVIAVLDGELTVKRLGLIDGRHWLLPENPDFQPIKMNPESDIHLWGVVTNVIHTLR